MSVAVWLAYTMLRMYIRLTAWLRVVIAQPLRSSWQPSSSSLLSSLARCEVPGLLIASHAVAVAVVRFGWLPAVTFYCVVEEKCGGTGHTYQEGKACARACSSRGRLLGMYRFVVIVSSFCCAVLCVFCVRVS